MSLSGGLAGNGKPAAVAHDVWVAEVNARGGLLGRPVEIVRYDDQSSGAQVPAIYTKLLDVDKVDLVVSGYATAIIAPAMPIVMQHGMAFVTLLGSGTNAEFNYDRCFNIGPSGSDTKVNLAKGYFAIASGLDPKPKTVAIAGLDADFQQRAMESARYHADRLGLKIVYDRTYPPTTVDFSPIVRGVQAAKPDIVFFTSYPPDSVGLLRSANELQLQAAMVGGVMIGPQVTAIRAQLGPILNNLVCWDVYAPEATMNFPGMDSFLARYRAAAETAKTDPLGLYAPPLAYAQMQVLEQAVRRVGKVDQKAIGADFHANEFPTVIGTLKIGAGRGVGGGAQPVRAVSGRAGQRAGAVHQAGHRGDPVSRSASSRAICARRSRPRPEHGVRPRAGAERGRFGSAAGLPVCGGGGGAGDLVRDAERRPTSRIHR